MLIDLDVAAKKLEKTAYDVCICGAGPAGISTARVLAANGKRVALFEGGGLEYTQESQDLYEGKTTESIGLEYWNNIVNCRLRFLGGTSNHWTGMCGMFEEEDLSREMNGLPAWPINREELYTYADEAKNVLDLPKDAIQEDKKWQGDNFENYVFSYSAPTRFKNKYLEEIKSSDKIDLFINASLTDMRLGKDKNSINAIEISNNNTVQYTFTATEYVLAMGAIENARSLLNANKQIPAGIGNQNDMVGRCFMEHFNIDYGRFTAEKNPAWGKDKLLNIRPNAKLMNQKQIGSGVITFKSVPQIEDFGRTAKLKSQLRKLVCESETAVELVRKARRFDCDGDGLVSSMLEQSPNLDSRVTLDTEKDRLGLNKIILDWRFNAFDLKTIRTIGLEASKELAKLGIARVQLEEPILNNEIDMKAIAGHCHQMGTTRMASNPKYGVVDEQLKVHGIKNLSIAGSSVYPSGVFCNPTFTLVSLSIRLGNHLSKKLSA